MHEFNLVAMHQMHSWTELSLPARLLRGEPPVTVRNVCVMHLRGVIKYINMDAWRATECCQILLHAQNDKCMSKRIVLVELGVQMNAC